MDQHDKAPYALDVDAGGDHLPTTGPAPRLSWRPGSEASQFELECHIGDVAQSLVSVTGHRFVRWPWRELQSREHVKWRVRGSAGSWSDWHRFEAGLLDADWQASWISPVEDLQAPPGRRPAYTLRRRLEVTGEPVRARVYASALGLYEVFVNGRRAGRSELTPGTSSYDQTVYAQAFDVTPLVGNGANQVEVLLSDGWYRGQVGAHREPARWGDELAIRLELHLDHADGTHQVLVTDETWSSSPSTILRADLMEGQTTDLTLADSSALRVPVKVTSHRPPAVSWSPAPPVRVIETRPPRSVTQLDDTTWIADFGQNASGRLLLTDLGPHGTRTVIDHGEHLDVSGDLDTRHLDGTRPDKRTPFIQRDEVVSSGTVGETFEPRHTVHGFRYARIRREGAEFDPSSVEMRVMHTDLRRTASFECSDEDLNRLHEIADWSFRGNAVDIPTDCPTRERLGWTGDYQVFAPTAARLYDVNGFTRKWLRSVRDDQLPDGRVANFSPDGHRVKLSPESQRSMMTGSAGWGDAIVHVPWEIWRAYGDHAALEENWQAMTRWVEWALETARTRRHPSRIERSATPRPHERFVWDGSFHWGEWLEPAPRAADGSPVNPVQADPAAWFSADKGEVGTAFLHRSTRTLAEIARILGHAEEARRYAETADLVKEAWQAEFLEADGRVRSDTQAGYVRALSFDLLPEGRRAGAADRLVELIRDAGTHLGTGFLSTADLLPVLADTGHADVAYEILLQRSSPSWLGMLDRGATTIWEDWDGVDEHGRAHESLNHYSKGAVIGFLHSHTLGLRQAPDSVAWETFVVAPLPGGGLTRAQGWFESPQGRIEVSWSLDGEEIEVTVSVPPRSRALITLPTGEAVRRGPGTWTERGPHPRRPDLADVAG